MKTLYLCCVLATLFTTSFTTETKARGSVETTRDSAQTIEIAKLLLIRLDEINAIDKSTLSQAETKALRKEARLIKGELKELEKGTYMPVGKLAVLLLVPFMIFNFTQ